MYIDLIQNNKCVDVKSIMSVAMVPKNTFNISLIWIIFSCFFFFTFYVELR